MPLKGLTREEAAWLRRKVRALGSLEAALRAIVAAGRSAEHTAQRVAPLVIATQRPPKP